MEVLATVRPAGHSSGRLTITLPLLALELCQQSGVTLISLIFFISKISFSLRVMTKQNNAINIRMQHTLTLYSADRDEAEINYDLCYSLTLSQFEMSSFDWFQGIFPLKISIKLKCLYSRLSLSSVCHHYRHYVIIVIIMSRSCYIAIGRYFMFSIIMSWPGENNDKSAQLACVLELFFVLWLCVSFNLYFYIRRAPVSGVGYVSPKRREVFPSAARETRPLVPRVTCEQFDTQILYRIPCGT